MDFYKYILTFFERIKYYSSILFSYVKLHKTPLISSTLLMLYIIFFYIFLFRSSNYTMQKYEYYTNIAFIIIGTIWSIGIMSKFMNSGDSINSNIFKYTKFIVGITLVLTVFFILLYIFTSSVFANNIVSFLINLGLIVFGLYIISYYIRKSAYYEKIKNSSFGNKLFNLTFGIPEFVINYYAFFMNDIKTTPNFIYKIIGIEIIFVVLYFLVPYIMDKIFTHDGTLLLGEPVYTDVIHTVGTFENLHKGSKMEPSGENDNEDINNPDYNYNYSVSFWLFLDDVGENYRVSTNKYTSILDYGGNPKIEYNGKDNILRVTMKKGKEGLYDTIYSSNNIQLQKWNNIVINYNSGITDIFMNGELVGTKNKILPYLRMDNIVLGEQKGYPGGICNVIYYKNTLSKAKINTLYEILRNKKRPY